MTKPLSPLSIKVPIKLFDSDLPLPSYQTSQAAGFDVYSRIDTVLKPQEIQYVPLNFALEIPPEYWVLLAARSSLHKRGLQLINGIGVGDPDYNGDHDEYRLLLYNFSQQPAAIKRGERLAQGLLIPRITADFQPVTSLAHNKNRGGLGSTGT